MSSPHFPPPTLLVFPSILFPVCAWAQDEASQDSSRDGEGVGLQAPLFIEGLFITL